MKRKDFLTTLGLTSASVLLPSNGFINEELINIYDNYIAGVQFYDFKIVETEIAEGDELLLVREQENKYDSFAVAVKYNNFKIGYLPAYENIVVANMLDKEVRLKAFVSQLNTQAYNSYRSVAVQIFAPLVTPTKKLVELIEVSQRADDYKDKYRNYNG